MELENVVYVPLSQGAEAVIDEADADLVLAHKWSLHRATSGIDYAVRHFRVRGYGSVTLSLHHFILNVPRKIIVDHANRNGLDCRRQNLRIATKSQNNANKQWRIGVSGYRGVSRSATGKRWCAILRAGGMQRHLGTFDTPEEAARVWDQAAREFHGPFAILNFPDVPEIELPAGD